MPRICTLAAGLLLAMLANRPAWGETFAANQLRLAETYLRAGNPIAAVAPLLNILRRDEAGTPDEVSKAKEQLARAYLELGLHGSARYLINELVNMGGPWSAQGWGLRVELHLRRGELQEAFQTLRDYGGRITQPIDNKLLFDVARAAFASRATFVTELSLDRLAEDGQQPEALFYAGIERLMAHEAGEAFRRFDKLAKSLDRSKDPKLFDTVHLALGRLYLESGDATAAARFYTAIPEESEYVDAALYETAWAYLAEGDEAAAAGNLLRLAIEKPFSALVPKSQVLYGYLLLRRGDFAAAERSFAGYVAHYAALSETIAELNAIPDNSKLYDEIFGRIDESIASGDDFRIELLTWLQKNPRLARSRRLVDALQAAERELTDLAHTLREVQSVSEGGPVALSVLEQAKREENEQKIRELRLELQQDITEAAGRFRGQAHTNYRKIEAELSQIHALRNELSRVRQRTIDKRRELVSLLQYADAGRLGVWNEGRLRSAPATSPTVISNEEANRMFSRLDESEEKTIGALRIVERLERKVLQARMQLLMARVPKQRLAGILEKQASLRKLEEQKLATEEADMEARRVNTRRTRRAVQRHIDDLWALRMNLIALSREAIVLRGAVTRTEMIKIERGIGSLLVHARLGNADVAWEARQQARARAREVLRQEQKDVASLRSYYQALSIPEKAKKDDAFAMPATSSLAQRTARLYEEAAAYDERLAFAERVLEKQREASQKLVDRLRTEGHAYDLVARADAAGLLIPEPIAAPGMHLLGVQLSLDGRKAHRSSMGLLLDSYMEPGSHQIDATVVLMDGHGELVRYQGSLHFKLESAKGYRIELIPEDVGGHPRLRFSFRSEVNR